MKLTLRAIRINNGWTLEEMAQKIGVSSDTLRNYEQCKTYPDVPIINRIIEVTGINYNDIIFLPNKYAESVEEQVNQSSNDS